MNSARNIIVGSLVAVALLVGLLMWNPRSSSAGKSADGTPAKPLLVYCAAGMKGPMEAIARDYERRFGVPVQLQFGGSGTLLSNLRVSKRGDLFLAADDSFLELARSNRLIAETFPLARMTPVIAVKKGEESRFRALAGLEQDGVSLAFANPEAAAIGKVCRDLLQQAGRWDALQPRIKVLKPTVNDLANDVKLGTVDAAFVWDSTVAQYPELEAVHVPELDTGMATVSLAVLSFTAQPTAALRFARFAAARDAGLAEFERHHFSVVRGDVWSEAPEVLLFSGGVNRLAIEDTLRQFEEREGVRVTRVYNGCGILTAQIRSGQRPDAYFACDVSFMNSVTDYFRPAVNLAQTRMVILTQRGNPKNLRNLSDLTKPGLALGVANEHQAALGALTARLLRSQGLLDQVMANVKVQTPTADLLVNQIRTGSLDAVVVYAANASQVRDLLDVIELTEPEALAIQPYAIGRNSEHAQLMDRLLAALRSTESRQRFEETGFNWRAPSETP
jgi:molybdenum ABC transporter molybdate-binding protein